MAKSCNFTFTHNNYDNTELQDTLDCKYIIYGKEISESGTPHLQGFVSFHIQRPLSKLIKILPGCHIEIARNAFQAMEYCKKDGDFIERGDPPLTPSQSGKKSSEQR